MFHCVNPISYNSVQVTLHGIEKKLYKKYPELETFVSKVQAVPQLLSYMSTRNTTVV